MRQIVYAASFVEDADAIAQEIEHRLGAEQATDFNEELEGFCEALADSASLDRDNQGYATSNWIFPLRR